MGVFTEKTFTLSAEPYIINSGLMVHYDLDTIHIPDKCHKE